MEKKPLFGFLRVCVKAFSNTHTHSTPSVSVLTGGVASVGVVVTVSLLAVPVAAVFGAHHVRLLER